MQIKSNWKYKHIQLYKSDSVASLTYVISPIMSKVSVLSNLHISGCELKDNYNISFILLFKTIFYRYIDNSLIFKSQCGFGLHILPRLGRVFCVFNRKYIKWKCFLGIL